MNVLDVAQNSIRAQATEIGVWVAEDETQDSLLITITDNGCGMTPEQLARVTDPFFTTRSTRRVGLGIPFFKMAAEMADGAFEIRSEQGKGTTVEASFRRSHIDLMPLGDMGETVSILICLNEGINVTYQYRFNKSVFEVSSKQLQEILDGVPLNTPSVMQFVKEYIHENMSALQKA